ncbi:MPT51 antigen [Ahrensia sp. R2A130]|nr:MPT51 antigen [Ahrensia sp. R2A130]
MAGGEHLSSQMLAFTALSAPTWATAGSFLVTENPRGPWIGAVIGWALPVLSLAYLAYWRNDGISVQDASTLLLVAALFALVSALCGWIGTHAMNRIASR